MTLHSKFQIDHKIKTIFTIAIFLALLILYIAILFTSQRYADGDEAVIGIMAKHIMEGKEFPIFYYGQPYGGGGAIEAYLAAIAFYILGISSLSLKAVALPFWLGTLLTTWFFTKRYFNKNIAFYSTIILATSSPLIEWHTKMRGGYAPMLLFNIAIIYCFMTIAIDNHEKKRNYLLLGFLSGFSYYNQELIISLLVTLLISTIFWRKNFWNPKAALLLSFGAIIGLFPLIYFNVTHDFENIRNLLSFTSGGLETFSEKLLSVPILYLPRFFNARNVDGYIYEVPFLTYLEYFAYCFIIFYSLNLLFYFFRSIFSVSFNTKPKVELIILMYVLSHIAIFTLSRVGYVSPRYLLPMFPSLAILAGLTVYNLTESSKKIFQLLGFLLLIILVGAGISNHIGYIRKSSVTDLVFENNNKRIEDIETPGETTRMLIDYLKSTNNFFVRCDYYLQWKILFESKEEIIASSKDFIAGVNRYPEYDNKVDAATSTAYIFYKESYIYQLFLRSKEAKKMRKKEISKLVVYTPDTRIDNL